MRLAGVRRLIALCEDIASTASSIRWPNPRYIADIEAFARDILGVDTVWDGQREIFRAVEQPESSVVVRAATKCGKTFSIAVCILWFYCSVADSTVAFTASNMKQAKNTVWREVLRLKAMSGRCVECRKAAAPSPCPHSAVIDGVASPSPAVGLRSRDQRRVVYAVCSNSAVAYAGISGGSRLFLVSDETTGISTSRLDYFRANRHGARCLYVSNPDDTTGFFYDAHTERQKGLHTLIKLSALDAAKVGIDGLATQKTIDEALRDLGEDSPLFLSKYVGDFPLGESTRLISRHILAEAVGRYSGMPEPDELLIVGLDPAGEGVDRTAVVARRGDKIVDIRDKGQLTDAEVVEFVLEVIRDLKKPDEKPELRFDCTGRVGSDVGRLLREHRGEVRVIPILFNATPTKKDQFRTIRDQLWWVGRMWLREGGAIPNHEHLIEELHAPDHSTDPMNRTIVDSKKIIKKRLGGRSPDFADAFILATWNDPNRVTKPANHLYSPEPARVTGRDPYSQRNTDRLMRGIYGRR